MNPNEKADAPPSSSSGLLGARKRKRLRKEEILAEATRLFAERGYEGASMGDLAERVGLRKASLFHHFPSKDVLYASVLSELVGTVQAAVVVAVTSSGSFAERLDAMSDAVTTAFGTQPHAARLLVREAMDWGPVMQGGLGDTINVVLMSAREFSKAGQRAGEFKPDADMTHIVVSMIGVLLMPFAVGEVVERFTGTSPFHASFVEERKVAVRAQVRDLMLVKRPAK